MFLCYSLRLLRNTYFADTEDHAEDVCIMKDFTIRNLKKISSHHLPQAGNILTPVKYIGQKHLCISSHPSAVYCSSQGSLPLPLFCHSVQFIPHGVTLAHFLGFHNLSLLDETKAKRQVHGY